MDPVSRKNPARTRADPPKPVSSRCRGQVPPEIAFVTNPGRSHSDRLLEVWFGDEARIGQKSKLTRRWAKRGTRPCAPQDQRTASTYIFGAICPKEGKGAALVMPWCNTEAMARHLAAISDKVEPGRHAALLLDRAGWHMSDDGKDSCGIITQGLLTGLPGWLVGHGRAVRRAEARAVC